MHCTVSTNALKHGSLVRLVFDALIGPLGYIYSVCL